MSDIVVSGKATRLIDQANARHGESKQLIMAAYEVLTKEDGLEPEAAAKYLLDHCEAFGKSTIYNILPAEAKDEKKALAGKSHKKSVPILEHKSQDGIVNNAKIIHKDSSDINISQPPLKIIDVESEPDFSNVRPGEHAVIAGPINHVDHYSPEDVHKVFTQWFMANKNNTGLDVEWEDGRVSKAGAPKKMLEAKT